VAMWQSTDPILHRYIRGEPFGGVYDPRTLGLFTYGRNNPLVFRDPTGKGAFSDFFKGIWRWVVEKVVPGKKLERDTKDFIENRLDDVETRGKLGEQALDMDEGKSSWDDIDRNLEKLDQTEKERSEKSKELVKELYNSDPNYGWPPGHENPLDQKSDIRDNVIEKAGEGGKSVWKRLKNWWRNTPQPKPREYFPDEENIPKW